jgi:formate hydrogenlyase subunit 6/NADH:ubiquinone oxidoreductase subunit I
LEAGLERAAPLGTPTDSMLHSSSACIELPARIEIELDHYRAVFKSRRRACIPCSICRSRFSRADFIHHATNDRRKIMLAEFGNGVGSVKKQRK